MKIKNSKLKINRYFPHEIEKKWQEKWESDKIYEVSLDSASSEAPRRDLGGTIGRYYNLVELPYPSGDLHLGHWFAFVPPDAHARYQRMKGKNVLFPNGFDAFGLPAENAAIKRGIHPKDWTMKNIENMRAQFATMGTMIDWTHTAITCEPDYYRWNQWIFLKMIERGIAYRGKALSNWCPKDQTVLANEHIENGKCWRCGSVVEQKEVEQWFLRITDFADELLWENTDEKISNGADWPKSVREAQNNWIGKSEGLLIQFTIDNLQLTNEESVNGQRSNVKSQYIEVFTTKPETTDGASFLVLAPEHPFVEELLKIKDQKSNLKSEEIREYVEKAKKKTELERKEDKKKSGVYSGFNASNPVTGKDIPVWISDYVLAGYGTGAIMAVPFADERDREFAEKFDLPIIETKFNASPAGEKKVNYHLRDWSISRQRYWGTPIPIIYCHKCWEANSKWQIANGKYGTDYVEIDGEKYVMNQVSYEDLPVEIPYEVDYTPKGKPPLASAEEWLNVKCPKCGGEAKRDAETLDTFFDSAWYYYRYASPDFDQAPFDSELVNKIMPVNVYFGGGEHTLGHTLYARFFTKFFKTLGLVTFDEFALKRVQHGVILGPDGNRMSKSRGNVVNPDDVVKEYGADTVRLYLCFMMPYGATAPWSVGAISGIYRFLKRIWDLQQKVELRTQNTELSRQDEYWLNKSIKKVGEDLENIHFNTAVSTLMEWLNYLDKKSTVRQTQDKKIKPASPAGRSKISRLEYETLLKLLAPFAPHISEEIWHTLTPSATSLHLESWPEFDEKKINPEEVNVAVQINGKVRGLISISAEDLENQAQIEEKAKHDPNISKYLKDAEIKKIIYIKGKILSFVV